MVSCSSPRSKFVVAVIGLCTIVRHARAADCNQEQLRNPGDPSGEQIANALTKDNGIESVCQGGFPPTNDLISTFNHGLMIYNVTRGSADSPLDDCEGGFQNIIDQCISGGDFWGGTFLFNDKIYSIYNLVYPRNGLSPGDDGGPPFATTTGSSDSAITPAPVPGVDMTIPGSIPGETVFSQTNSEGNVVVGTVRTFQ